MAARRGHGERSIYQRKSDGRWVSSIDLGYVNGKRKRKPVYGKTRKEVPDKLKVVLRDQQQGLSPAPGHLTVAQILDQWLVEVKGPTVVRPRTRRSYEQLIRLYLKPALGRHQLSKLTAPMVQAMVNDLAGRGLSPHTVRRTCDVLKNALGQAVDWDLIPRNVATRVTLPRLVSKAPRYLSAEEPRVLLADVRGDRLEALYTVALAMGLRQGESLVLQWQDVDSNKTWIRAGVVEEGSCNVAKRRPNNDGSIRRRPDGTWEARISLPGGKRKSVYGKTQKVVQDKKRALQQQLASGLAVTTGRQTIRQYLEHWLEHVAKPGLRASTYKSYANYVRLHIIPGLGHHQLTQLAPQHVQTFLNEKSTSGLSPRTVQYIRAILRRALNQAVKWNLVERNVATLVTPPRSVKTQIVPLSADEAMHFIEYLRREDHRLGPLFTLAIVTGLRQGELFGLRWNDIDIASARLMVRFAMQRVDGERTFVEPKTALSRRMVSLETVGLTALKSQWHQQLKERACAGEQWQDWGLVFTSTIGTPLEPSNVGKRLHQLLEDAGLPRQRFHDLRHCAASLILAGGGGARDIMEILGHSQISLTMNTYAHLSPAMNREAVRALESALSGSRNLQRHLG